MERLCAQCHAVIAAGTEADWCPACGGAIISRTPLPGERTPQTVDRRGIVLPRRHALGGVISPQ